MRVLVTRDQNLARQIEQLHDAGVNKIFQEKLSGKNADRPQLKAMLAIFVMMMK